MDAAGVGSRVLMVADPALDECGACATFDKAPRLPLAGTLATAAFNEKARADLFL